MSDFCVDVGAPMRFSSGGIDIWSDLDLPGVPQAPAGHRSTHVLRLERGPTRPVPNEVPRGALVADFEGPQGRLYCAVRHDEGFTLRFFGVCDVQLDADLTLGEVSHHPDAPPGMAEVLLAGTTLAFVLTMLGRCVLHASAVEVGGRALAFVGHSGMGKSTLALAACAAGARLIAEDVLAIVVHENGVDCLPGNTDMRLRKSALSLLQGVPDATRFQTPDGRQGVRPNLSGDESIRLDTVVIPRPMRSANELSVVRLPAVEALFRLMNFPRVDGLIEPGVVRTQFQGSGVVARSVPVLVAEVPWRQPLQPNLGRDLLALMSRLPTSSDPA